MCEFSLERWKTFFSVSLQWISAVHNVLLSDWFINRWAASLKGVKCWTTNISLIFWDKRVVLWKYRVLWLSELTTSSTMKKDHLILIIYDHPPTFTHQNAYKVFRIEAFSSDGLDNIRKEV